MEKTIVLKPRISEKTYMLSETTNTYVVEVPRSASKDMIAKAMTAQFGVAVKTVNVTNVKGKPKRTVRKGGRPSNGKRSDFKKAFVTLLEGQKLPFFAEAEDDKKSDKKADKKADKKEKETK
jgi:large subunit ribosomal protein L23